jgi:hypothetical protein
VWQGNNPFWGFDTIRRVMRRQRPFPAVGLTVSGVVLIAVGALGAPALAVIGAVALAAGVWGLVSRHRSAREASQLEAAAAAEDPPEGRTPAA